MSKFGWSYPAGCTGTPYDEDPPCDVCGADSYDCDCPECPMCSSVGDPKCYAEHGLKPAHDSIASFLDHIGIEPLSAALRAIDKYNVEHVWIVLPDGRRIYYHTDTDIDVDAIPTYTRLHAVGVGGIAWDGSDWEWSTEVSPGNGWSDLDAAREGFLDALDEHTGGEE